MSIKFGVSVNNYMISKTKILIAIMLLCHVSARDWVEFSSPDPAEPVISVVSSTQESIRLTFELSGYFSDKKDNGNMISFPGGVSMLEKGSPDLPITTESIQIPDLANMELKILDSDFIDLTMKDIIPSKGNITRDIKIQDIPYEKGDVYQEDKFFPEDIPY